MEDISVIGKLIEALAGRPEYLLLCVILIGGGWLSYKIGIGAIRVFRIHAEQMAEQLKSLETSKDLRSDVKELIWKFPISMVLLSSLN